MINLSNYAKNRLDKYLKEVRTSLRDCVTVDRDEVERNVIEHIENELADVQQPVACEDLERVLTKLGSPSQWVPEEDIPWWRRVLHRLRTGPEDWRLAYLSFGLLLLSFFFAGARTVLLGPLAILAILRGSLQGILLLASFILARAVVSTVEDTKKLGGQKWLIYPSLLIVYIPLVCLLLLWPLLVLYEPAFGLAQERIVFEPSTGWLPSSSHRQGGISGILMVLNVIGLWWIVLGIIGCTAARLLKVIFKPFADNFKRKWPALLIVIGIVLVIARVGIWFFMAAQRGHLVHY